MHPGWRSLLRRLGRRPAVARPTSVGGTGSSCRANPAPRSHLQHGADLLSKSSEAPEIAISGCSYCPDRDWGTRLFSITESKTLALEGIGRTDSAVPKPLRAESKVRGAGPAYRFLDLTHCFMPFPTREEEVDHADQ
jgi:hypothetical protein